MKKYFILLVLIWLLGCQETSAPLNNEANQDFEVEAYETALQKYRQAQSIEPDLAEPYYNAGNALYEQGDLEQSELQLKMALRHAEEEQLIQKTFYNRGNVFYQSENYEASAEAYKEALRLKPDDVAAKHNLELALKKLDEQRQQSQEQQQPMEQPDGPEQQDTQPQNQPEQSDQENDDPQEEQGQQTQPDQQQAQEDEPLQSGQPMHLEAFTEEQARQLLEAIAQETNTLQERLQQLQPQATTTAPTW